MSFDLIKQMGLGFVLEFTDKTSKEARAAAKELRNLKGEVQDLTKDYVKQAEMIEKQAARSRQMMVQGASVMAGGAALLAPAFVAGRKAMQDEHMWTGRVTQAMAQQNLSRLEAVRIMAKEKDFVDSLANSEIGLPSDQMDAAFIKLQGLMNNSEAAAASYQNIMRMAAVTTTDAVQSVEAYNIAYKMFKDSMGNISEQEKSLRITNALAFASRKYSFDVSSMTGALRQFTEEAGIMNPSMEQTFALMTPLLAMGKLDRMVGSGVAGVMVNMLNFDKKVKDMRKELGKPELSLTDFLAKDELRKSISPQMSKLMNIRMTGPGGEMRGFTEVLSDIESTMGITKEAMAKVDEQIAAGKIPENQRMAALGLTGDAQRALIDSFGIQIGNFIGKSEAIKRMEVEFRDTGYITEAFGATAEDADFQLQILKNQFGNLAEDIGTNLLPVVKDLSKEIRPWLQDLTDFAKNNPNFVKTALVSGGIVGGAAELGGGAMVLGGAAMNTYLGYKSWRLMREMKAASQAAATVADDAAVAGAKAAASQVDDAVKQIVKSTATAADDAFFSEFTAAKELPKNILGKALIEDAATAVARETQRGAARELAGMMGKGIFGAAKGFVPLAAASIIPTPFDSKLGYSADVERALMSGAIRHGDIRANLIETGMFNPVSDQRLGTTLDHNQRMRESMDALARVYFDTSLGSKANDAAPAVQQNFGNIYIVTPAGSNPQDYVDAFDRYVKDKADRSPEAQF